MEPVHPPKEYPWWGRGELDHAHAPYMIVRSLQRLGLSDWAGTLLDWLGRYDGIEEHLHADLDPPACVRDVLAEHADHWPALAPGHSLQSAERRARIEAIVEDILQLEFLTSRAYWGPWLVKKIVWDPLQEHWMWFLQYGPDFDAMRHLDEDRDVLQVWTRFSEDPEFLQATRRVLLEEVALGEDCRGEGDGDLEAGSRGDAEP